MAAAMITSALQETQTWDEAGHLTAGYLYLKTGSVAFYTDHPPLRTVFALPLLFFHLRIPTDRPEWAERNQTTFATQFLYTQTYHPDTLLLAGRCVAIALTLAFALVVFNWTRRQFDYTAALIALALFAFDPNLIAHGRYITTDMLAAFTFFLAVIAWNSGRPIPAGLALGLALTAKFSAIALLPILLLLAILQRRMSIRDVAAALAVAAAVVALVIAPDPHAYLTGLDQTLRKSHEGHEAYLLGMYSQTGWWYYFPVVFAVKTPIGLLLALAIAAYPLARRPKSPLLLSSLAPLLLASAAFFGISMISAVNIGVRHILPVYPMLCVVAAAAITRLPRGRLIATACAAIVAIESASIYPNYLAFFNFASGGPAAGPRYLLDSNIDWGQDVKKLRTWLRARNIPSVCMFYFGNTGVEFYGIPMEHLPRTNEIELRRNLDCVAAISVTNLYGLYVPHDAYAWLRDLKPTAKIGWSIYVYDLRKTR
jgi:Dolichyl-phosphate-mannose-protein mannosyltransferase